MSDARNDILGNIRTAISKDIDDSLDPFKRNLLEAKDRLSYHPVNLIPARGNLGQKARVDLFVREAERVNATVARVSSLAGVPREIMRFLTNNNLSMTLKISPEISEKKISWTKHPLLKVEEVGLDGTEDSYVSNTFAAVAETGTLVALSGQSRSTSLNFLPRCHVCLLNNSDIVGSYEEVWAQLRNNKKGKDNFSFLPRTVNWITGPSRTADIEQTLLIGAHGPQRLHIVIIND